MKLEILTAATLNEVLEKSNKVLESRHPSEVEEVKFLPPTQPYAQYYVSILLKHQ